MADGACRTPQRLGQTKNMRRMGVGQDLTVEPCDWLPQSRHSQVIPDATADFIRFTHARHDCRASPPPIPYPICRSQKYLVVTVQRAFFECGGRTRPFLVESIPITIQRVTRVPHGPSGAV